MEDTSVERSGAEAEVHVLPVVLERSLSDEYESQGASNYSVEVLEEWCRHRHAAQAAMRTKDWPTMAAALRQALALRPDWGQGYKALLVAERRMGDTVIAQATLQTGFAHCLFAVRQLLQNMRNPRHVVQAAQELADELLVSGSADLCTGLNVATEDKQSGEAFQLYHSINADIYAGAEIDMLAIRTAPKPLRLLFLDVDGVLNTSGTANSGELLPVMVAHVHAILRETGAAVALSSSWRSFRGLRPLVIAACPQGSVIGQTPSGFTNHTRPAEIATFLKQPTVMQAMDVEGSSWAVVDDMDLVAQAEALAVEDKEFRKAFLPELRQRFIRTNKYVGLDEGCAQQLTAILKSLEASNSGENVDTFTGEANGTKDYD